MIQFGLTQDKKRVCVGATYGATVLWFFPNNEQGEGFAAAARDALHRQYGDLIEENLTRQYDAGYKDGRAKNRKATWWPRWLKP